MNDKHSDVIDEICSQYKATKNGFWSAFRSKLVDDWYIARDENGRLITRGEYCAIEGIKPGELDFYLSTDKAKFLPDCWLYSEERNPAYPDVDVASFWWIEVVNTHNISRNKLDFLFWLKDWADGEQCFKTERHADVRFFRRYVTEKALQEFDPYEEVWQREKPL